MNSKGLVLDRPNRLSALSKTLRQHYLDTSNHRYMVTARKVEAALRQHHQRNTAFGKLHWVQDGGWRTSYDDVLRAMIDQNLVVAAIDTEYDNPKRNFANSIRELGISIYRNGEINTRHILIEEPNRHFRYGETEYMSREYASQALAHVMQEVDVLLFWSADCDVKIIKGSLGLKVPRSKLIDVVTWQQPSPGQQYSLKKFCDHYGVPHLGAHNAGNDAHALMLVTLTALGVTVKEKEEAC
jgi:hypothetical protein